MIFGIAVKKQTWKTAQKYELILKHERFYEKRQSHEFVAQVWLDWMKFGQECVVTWQYTHVSLFILFVSLI